MTTYVLNKDNPLSGDITSKGDLCICAVGTGSFRILREMGSDYHPVTNDQGSPLEFASDGGLAFNGHISCDVRRKYKIRATGEMVVTVVTEK